MIYQAVVKYVTDTKKTNIDRKCMRKFYDLFFGLIYEYEQMYLSNAITGYKDLTIDNFIQSR